MQQVSAYKIERPTSVIAEELRKQVIHVKVWIKSIAGGVPAQPDLLEAHLLRKGLNIDRIKRVMGEVKKASEFDAEVIKGIRAGETPPDGIDLTSTSLLDALQNAAKSSTTIFLYDEVGVYLVGSQWKAMVREGMEALNITRQITGSKHYRQVAIWVETSQRDSKIYLKYPKGHPVGRKEGLVVQPEDVLFGEKPIQAKTPMGRRACLLKYGYLMDIVCEFDVTIVEDPVMKITADLLKEMFAMGEQGIQIGAHRPLDFGDFIVVEWDVDAPIGEKKVRKLASPETKKLTRGLIAGDKKRKTAARKGPGGGAKEE